MINVIDKPKKTRKACTISSMNRRNISRLQLLFGYGRLLPAQLIQRREKATTQTFPDEHEEEQHEPEGDVVGIQVQ